jgi:hypothetical protein
LVYTKSPWLAFPMHLLHTSLDGSMLTLKLVASCMHDVYMGSIPKADRSIRLVYGIKCTHHNYFSWKPCWHAFICKAKIPSQPKQPRTAIKQLQQTSLHTHAASTFDSRAPLWHTVGITGPGVREDAGHVTKTFMGTALTEDNLRCH